MSENESIPPDGEETSKLLDSYFKYLTSEEAKSVGIKEQPSELQYTTFADLVFAVPAGVQTKDTLFEFFRSYNIVEFKSESETLTLQKYIKNDVRTDILFLQRGEENFDNILNVYVVARYPEKFFDLAKKRDIKFNNSTDKPWLYEGQVGFQDVAIVVCRELPLDERYYKWLMFAPAKSHKWERFILKLVDEGKNELREIAKKLRPKEYAMITQEIMDKIEAELSPQEKARLKRDTIDALEILLKGVFKNNLEGLSELFARLTPEERELLLELLSKKSK
jgi:hypothetical protein